MASLHVVAEIKNTKRITNNVGCPDTMSIGIAPTSNVVWSGVLACLLEYFFVQCSKGMNKKEVAANVV